MDIVKGKWRRNMFLKAWKRSKPLGDDGSKKQVCCYTLQKSTSWHSTTSDDHQENLKRKHNRQVAPDGCFSVYVGPEKQRFVVKTEFANHPLFKMLLEDAETEYGFHSDGPLLLPCNVDLFYKVLAEMDSGDDISAAPPSCGGALGLCSPSRRSSYGNHKGYGSYRNFSLSRPMLKFNQV